jgi:NTP pyrophosphatase (non-canonical NTP hydrolase)
MQLEFDSRHDFPVEFDSDKDRLAQISKDLIGVVGEIGEFANIIKKMNLEADLKDVLPKEYFKNFENELKEELVDTFIYLIRLAKLVDLNLELEYLKKRQKNEAKYEPFQA